MTRRLVVLDVDSTLIENEVIELLAEEAGCRDRVARITESAMRGELDFASSLRERVATLVGLTPEQVARVRSRIVITRGVPELIRFVKASGGHIGVVSGGFHEVLDPLAEILGLDCWRANRLEVDQGGSLTGRLHGPIIDAQAKALALREWADDFEVPMESTVAIGDGANDLDMMRAAGVSVAFCAKPVVRQAATFSVDQRDMRAVMSTLGWVEDSSAMSERG